MYNNIQALRGIAAFLVVIFHLLPHFRAMGLSNVVFESIAQYGYAGVDVFFVISGFVMAKTTQNLPRNFSSAKQFITKRFLRIYSGYLPIFAFALLYYSTYSPDFVKEIDLVSSLFLTSTDMQKLLLGVSWSLTYELFFYSLIAFILLTKLSFRFVFFTVAFMVIIKNIFFPIIDFSWLNFSLSLFLLEFMAGFFLFSLLRSIAQPIYLPILIILALISLYFGVTIPMENNWIRIMTFGVFGFAVIWILLALEINEKLIIRGTLKRIGDASYSLYLVHIVFVNMFYTSGIRTALVTHNIALLGFIVYTIMIVIISLLIYKWIELPLYKKVIRGIMPRG